MTPATFPEVFSLRGEHALITGGGTGIGLAVGARVTLVGWREAELAAAIADLGTGAAHVVHDITQSTARPN
jgi:gluconate 5-dehydrogenase